MGSQKLISKDLRIRVDMKEVLDRLGIAYKVDGDELKARCPNPKHVDRRPSWSIRDDVFDEKNGFFYCFSCGWSGDVYNLIMTLKECTFLDALLFLEKCKKHRYFDTSVDDGDIEYNNTFSNRQPVKIRKPLGLKWIGNGSLCMGYLANRGIGRKEIDEFGLMDWVVRKRVFVPVYLRKDFMVTWVARSYVEGTIPKILYPSNSSPTWGIFGYDRLSFENKKIVLTEGWVSAIRLMQARFENVVSTCGSRITEEQAELISVFDEITIWKEGDHGGEKFERNVNEWLGFGRNINVVSLPVRKDPADFLPEDLIRIYKEQIGD